MKKRGLVLTSISAALVVLFFGPMDGFAENGATYQGTSEYQLTPAYCNVGGKITRNMYSQPELEKLTSITHGDVYNGNTSLDTVSTDYVYQLEGANLTNFVGSDGILQLYNTSELMTMQMAESAAAYWNKLAGAKIVEIVATQAESDETIRDSDANGIWVNGTLHYPLGGQSYNGDGILFYPNHWQLDSTALPKAFKNNWKVATLIHEIGHALGIPHLGGGSDGENAIRDNVLGTEFMCSWAVGVIGSPLENIEGVRSSKIDAAALAMAGLTWEKPRKVASWLFSEEEASVLYNNGVITSSVPYGAELDFKGNYIQSKQLVDQYLLMGEKNYNVYLVNDDVIVNHYFERVPNHTTTKNLELNGKTIHVIGYYPSTKGNPYYRVAVDNQEYVINSAAFAEKVV
ncbi:hypothetical protein [Candidatus Enterococcus clewellii]|uniref:Peptidase M10 metallopeptidase domain-containing protein n=1 Tax=Candidatus Enterococcus clewellii TaxID=1834193 RepID=A0A242K549_9ENTE|nr:hypothetical protein [Enterococcus sp. 9E7_DIV0242]OTP13504.1 hypothetical protein A5888_002982 [Enterococcus sp. 9E7_DIV0242]